MTDEYPKMLYRDGTAFEWDGRALDTLIVDDAAGEAAALADGWRVTGNPLDHDGDGKPGGSRKPRKAKADE